MSGRESRGATRRRRKHRERTTRAEVQAFRRGMETHKEAVGPTIKRRAALVGCALGFILGVGCTAAAQHLLGL